MIDVVNRVLNKEQVFKKTAVRDPASLILAEDKGNNLA